MGTASEQYLESVHKGLADDGCEITRELVNGEKVLVGYRGNFKAATKMHTFTVVAQREMVNAADVREFTSIVVNLAKERNPPTA